MSPACHLPALRARACDLHTGLQTYTRAADGARVPRNVGTIHANVCANLMKRPTMNIRWPAKPVAMATLLVSLLGGVEMFGLMGVIVGPILMSLCLSILRIYEQERERSNLQA